MQCMRGADLGVSDAQCVQNPRGPVSLFVPGHVWTPGHHSTTFKEILGDSLSPWLPGMILQLFLL